MLEWIGNAASNIGSWLGSGVDSFFNWLLGGISQVVEMVVNAAGALWDALDSIWDFAWTFQESWTKMIDSFFPFIPEPVFNVIALGFICVLVAGIVKAVRK